MKVFVFCHESWWWPRDLFLGVPGETREHISGHFAYYNHATKCQLKAWHQANFRSQQGGKNNNEANSKRNPFRNANRSKKIICCLLSSTFFAINQILLSIGVCPRCFNSRIKWNIYRRRSIRGHSLALEELFITTRHTLQIWKVYDSLRSVNRGECSRACSPESGEQAPDSGACSHTGHYYSWFCLADISQAKNGEIQIVVYFTRLRCSHNPCLST